MFETLGLYFAHSFVRYAFIVGILISLCSSLLGVTLVLKRFSFIGDGLSHVAFGAICIAAVMNLTNNMLVVLPVTILAAVLLLKSGKNAKIKGDAAVAMISVSSLAIGYLLMNLFSTSSNLSGDVCSTLFGSTSILTLSKTDVLLCTILSLLVIILFIIFYNKIFAVTFDENFAQAVGTHASVYNLMIAIIIAVIIVLAMNLVGSLLISALVIFPALSAMRIFKSFKSVTICSVIVSVFCSASGLLISILAGTPVGSTIVAANLIVFILFTLIRKWNKKFGQFTLSLLSVFCILSLDSCAKKDVQSIVQPASVIPTEEKIIEIPDIPTMEELKNVQGGQFSLDKIDIDLTKMSSTMIYAEVFNMVLMPDEYENKTLKIKGNFAVYISEQTGEKYFSIIIPDATQCCQQGIDFVVLNQKKYPQEFPKIGQEITLVGKYETMQTSEGLCFNYLVTDEISF